MPLSSQHSHSVCLVESFGARTHLCVEESRGYDVYTCKFSPLSSQRLSKVGDEGLATVVDRLVGWHVDDVGTHAGCDDEVTETLTLEDLASVFCRVNNAVNCVLLDIEYGLGKGAYR